MKAMERDYSIQLSEEVRRLTEQMKAMKGIIQFSFQKKLGG